MNMFNRVFSQLLDILFPSTCISCKKVGCFLCKKCAEEKRVVTYHKDKDIYSVFLYKDPVIKKALLMFKFRNAIELSDIFAENMYHIIKERNLLDEKKYYLIPIPQSKKNKRRRNFNPNVLICEKLKTMHHSFVLKKDLLLNISSNPQTKILNKKDRIENIREKIIVTDKNFKADNVILVDDVFTTGATIKEARDSLIKHKVSSIKTFVIAH